MSAWRPVVPPPSAEFDRRTADFRTGLIALFDPKAGGFDLPPDLVLIIASYYAGPHTEFVALSTEICRLINSPLVQSALQSFSTSERHPAIGGESDFHFFVARFVPYWQVVPSAGTAGSMPSRSRSFDTGISLRELDRMLMLAAAPAGQSPLNESPTAEQFLVSWRSNFPLRDVLALIESHANAPPPTAAAPATNASAPQRAVPAGMDSDCEYEESSDDETDSKSKPNAATAALQIAALSLANIKPTAVATAAAAAAAVVPLTDDELQAAARADRMTYALAAAPALRTIDALWSRLMEECDVAVYNRGERSRNRDSHDLDRWMYVISRDGSGHLLVIQATSYVFYRGTGDDELPGLQNRLNEFLNVSYPESVKQLEEHNSAARRPLPPTAASGTAAPSLAPAA